MAEEIKISDIKGIINLGDSFLIKQINPVRTDELLNRFAGTVYEHLVTAREEAAKLNVFIATFEITSLGATDLGYPICLGKVFKEARDYPEDFDVLIHRVELMSPLGWNDKLEKMYNTIIKYENYYYSEEVLRQMKAGEPINQDDYIKKVALNANLNALVSWLGE
jgi:hypothetical protein